MGKYVPEKDVPATSLKLNKIYSTTRLIAIGASTGGPIALKTIIQGLPKQFPVPVLIVQHIALGFIQGMADWIGLNSNIQISIAQNDEYVLPGHVYLAPNNCQMGIEPNGKIILSDDNTENGLRPSVSYLFRSVANSYGRHAVGVLLTGMGHDGAKELKLMKDTGAVTIAQDEKSSAIYGMPGEAKKINGAKYILPPDEIVKMLISLTNKKFD